MTTTTQNLFPHHDVTNHPAWELQQEEYLNEISGWAYVLRHKTRGSRLLIMHNDDEDKAFSVSFKTPPQDSTGVFHILEHSVLCGSKRFPVKEPFVNLLKSSMQTFLNALTFSDKTMYPVSSTNEKDLLNLMEVYFDAVFNPRIYEQPETFMQEGWHLEYAEDKLTRTGVVYNEMKGVFADPDSVLYSALSQELFPDTCYGFESGGDPQYIKNLSYEDFLDHHKRHYQADNAYFSLYGNIKIDTMLTWLDEHLCNQTPACTSATNILAEQSPRTLDYSTVPMNTAPENSCVAYASVIGSHNSDNTLMKDLVATGILMDALMGSNESPLKQRLLASGCAHDFLFFIDDAKLQPFLMIEAKSLEEGAGKRFKALLQNFVQEICHEGIDKSLLEAALARDEFVLRERDFSMPTGIINSMTALSTWLYNDNAALMALKFEPLYKALRDELASDYYEKLLERLICESSHSCLVELIPSKEEIWNEEQELQELKHSLTDNKLSGITAAAERLHRIQEQPDSEEDLASLPSLELADLSKPKACELPSLRTDSTIPCIVHNIQSNGILYLNYYFDYSHINFDDVHTLAILSMLLGKLNTQQYSASEIDTLSQLKLGKLHISLSGFSHSELGIIPRLGIETSALEEHAQWALDLPSIIWSETQFDDSDKILALLKQRKIAFEQYFMLQGNAAGRARLSSYTNKLGVLREHISGIDMYDFLCDLIANYEDKKDELREKLQKLAQSLFSTRCIASICAPEHMRSDLVNKIQKLPFTQYEHAQETSIETCAQDLLDVGAREVKLHTQFNRILKDQLRPNLIIPEPNRRNEAFVIPGDVNYVSFGSSIALLKETLPSDAQKLFNWEELKDHDAYWVLLNRVLSFDYLWNTVRVLGGAYGAGFNSTRSGELRFSSYRDPHLDKSIQAYQNTSLFLREFEPSTKEFEGYIIASVASLDAPLKLAGRAAREDGRLLSNKTQYDSDVLRQNLITAKLKTLKDRACVFEELANHAYICVFGQAQSIQDSKYELSVRELFG